MKQLTQNSGGCTAHFEENVDAWTDLSSDDLDPATIKALAKLDCSLETMDKLAVAAPTACFYTNGMEEWSSDEMLKITVIMMFPNENV
ncbi:hypothetical protein PILCRDRAFT_828218 [Piloderma croceum F 1598]|uniref:Uncharacterized protein n=1 Tax=Piloderma croceum (strain F 1598) TaxID=765440 RepID=A0A0C3F377_PILCF|nr:hypothetical protein PILCRDRAFT_828218 [Piloderma croceum F 1598]